MGSSVCASQGTGSAEHYHRNAINALVHGSKQWWLVPRHAAGFSVRHPLRIPPRAHESEGALRCVQHAGEIMYVPRGWGHAVVNHADTVGLAFEFIDGREPDAP